MADWDDNRDDPHGGDAAYMLWPHKLLVGAVQQSGWCGEVHPNNSAPWDSFKSIEQCNTSTKIGCLFNVRLSTPQHSIDPAICPMLRRLWRRRCWRTQRSAMTWR